MKEKYGDKFHWSTGSNDKNKSYVEIIRVNQD